MSREAIRAEAQRLAEECRDLVVGVDVTLNGKPATLSGFALPFAKVSDRQTGLSAEWSWHAVHKVLTESKGAFAS